MRVRATISFIGVMGFTLPLLGTGCKKANPPEPDGVPSPSIVPKLDVPAGTKQAPEFIERIVSIRIPVLHFEDALLEEALDFIRLRMTELDPEVDPSKRGISMLTHHSRSLDAGLDSNGGANTRPLKQTYSAKDKRVDEIFTDLAKLYDIEFHVTDVGIVVTPPGNEAFPNAKATEGEVYYTYKATSPAPAPEHR